MEDEETRNLATAEASRKHHRTTIEEIDDEDSPGILPSYAKQDVYIQDFPKEKEAGKSSGSVKTSFEEYQDSQRSKGLEPWAPFKSEEDWEHFRWMVESGVSWGNIDRYLRLKKVRDSLDLPQKTGQSFRRLLDKLPKGPKFTCTPLEVTGNVEGLTLPDGTIQYLGETLELWHRDPVSCIRELISNPSFKEHLTYAPEKHFRNPDGTNREYDEMWTANWWWDTQVKLRNGSTIAAVTLASDKTQLSTFSGDKQAWPVYLSLGNIDKHIRRQPSSRASILIGYIPTSKLECFTPDRRSVEGQRLFHDCMRLLLKPLALVGRDGVDMTCADGQIRHVHPILAAYIADYIEQCLVACCRENSCPRCLVDPKKRGVEPTYTIWRDAHETIEILVDQSEGKKRQEFKEQNLRPINPFWSNLPYCDIFGCFTPDLLHQIHKGVFGDHLADWVAEHIGKSEVDQRFRAMTPHPTLRYFKKGVSTTTQWTGREYKEMEKVYLGAISGAADPKVIRTTRAIMDFTYYARFEVHTDESLSALDDAWVSLHRNKVVFETLGIRKHFNISKLHNIKHYVDSIRSRGTTDGYNTEASERLHIDYVKMGYRASNKRNYTVQMTSWLARREAVQRFASYLQWAVPGYHGGDEGDDEEGEGGEGGNIREDREDDNAGLEGKDKEEDDDELTTTDTSKGPIYSVARQAPVIPSIPTIENEYCAKDFGFYLERYLTKADIAFNPILHTTRFPVYKQFTIQHPSLQEATSEPGKDVVSAQLATPDGRTKHGGIKKGTPAKTSTVLVRTDAGRKRKRPVPTDGLSIARVRVIFRLPESIGMTPTPLAYVNWFRPLQGPGVDNAMYKVSLDKRAQYIHSGIVPITDIPQTCHLIPCFGPSVNDSWNPDSVLDQAASFYVNPYLRLRDFFLLRYQVWCSQRRESDLEEERELRRKRAKFAMTLE
ncbi:hypothetical protein BDN72DRAFT_873010 [Pluteus cervinus]|uniref:Uncharacterized protein n=1 Tax=Pluteus cervinus TaxID=181527 RepID=A0ACD3A208_9AGAR|nr:hypothetical protein BDN72DRAFT_873010 [Pluteus cervinus]